jgi:hypothetical protein
MKEGDMEKKNFGRLKQLDLQGETPKGGGASFSNQNVAKRKEC